MTRDLSYASTTRLVADLKARRIGSLELLEHFIARIDRLNGVALLPSTAAPAGRTAQGLPVGVQIVGPYLGDRTTIAFAGHLAEVIGGFEVPPGYG
jgi:Asp-tRNA(Asn)/Glu-tRNA(Gln) amidotransferase A subunit family amidase